ncbi:MAG: polysaccharide deacetylase family protein [Erysipelotrichaceae bacterium]|nr:polysaccharide deacetylase family protein [Erysipelotrichaceae bacterium]
MKKVFFSLSIFFGLLLIYLLYQQPRIHFIQDEIHLSLYDTIEPYDYIESISHIDIEELTIDNQVNNKALGEYTIYYQYHQYTFSLKIYIDDTISPEFETIDQVILRNETLDPYDLVTQIQDESATTVYFKEDYIFNEIKTYEVHIIVEDAYHNTTEKIVYVKVEESDTNPPTLSGINKLTLLLGDEIDLNTGITIEDDHDDNPTYTIDDSSLNLKQIGEYTVYYHVLDKYGNEETYSRDIEILSPYDNREATKDGIKTCYLTFDDGPSSNTKEILEILDKYNIKATFFVTGTSPDYFNYIKEAYENGHVIGLHSYSHDYEYIYTSVRNYLNDLNKIKEVVYQQTGEYTKYIRFPGGSSNLVSKKYNVGIMRVLTKKVIDLGYQYYDWTSINGDGEGIKTVDGLIDKALEEIDGKEDIMFLMHDSGTQDNTVTALPDILDELIERGYEFKTIDDTSPTFHHTIQN